jgi:hypothetical protein
MEITNLSVKNQILLLQTIGKYERNDIEFVRDIYLQYGTNFDDNLDFLVAIEIIRKQDDKLKLAIQPKKDPELIRTDIRNNFFSSLDLYPSIVEYLCIFSWDDKFFSSTPSPNIRRKFCAERNLLIELDVVIHKKSKETYYINSKYEYLYLRSEVNSKKISPKTLRKIQQKQKEIGLSAELEIINYEKNRLLNFLNLVNQIEHISKIDESLGYDIVSFTNDITNGNSIKRYIEVKAVSVSDYKFYMSRNEVETSQKFGNQYYLYLLPVISNGEFSIDKLQIIENPYNYFFVEPTAWQRVIESYSFRII